MPRSPRQQTRVYEAILQQIQGGHVKEGAQLPSVRELAAEYGVSLLTVQRALERLAAQGIVVREHGKGVFVADQHRPAQMSDSVVLCIPSQDHLWGTLCMQMVYGLGQLGVAPHVVDGNTKRQERMIRQLSLSEAPIYVVLGGMNFPFSALERPAFLDKTLIGVVRWESLFTPPNLYQVLCDQKLAGRDVAKHLWQAGHRRAMFLGTPNAQRRVTQGPVGPIEAEMADQAFADAWRKLGGELVICSFSSGPNTQYELDLNCFLSSFGSDTPPTAIFAQFDMGAWLAQQAILRDLPELDGQVEIIGFGDTPWAHAAFRSISSVNLQLPLVAERTCDLIAGLRRGETPAQRLQRVPCRLALRDTSRLHTVDSAAAAAVRPRSS